jgi:hypothetical protein
MPLQLRLLVDDEQAGSNPKRRVADHPRTGFVLATSHRNRRYDDSGVAVDMGSPR